ncbi:MAG: lipase [Leptotrichiaceae bacterium]|nr:lipase [Leptotrichiaceae bacterium]
MKIKYKKLFMTVFIFTSVVFLSLKITKFLLYHEYDVKDFGNKADKGIVVTFHGIYGESEDMKTISDILGSKGYKGVNIQYPTTEGTIEEITEKYISKHIILLDEAVEKENIQRRKKNLPEIKLHFIVHSLGSVILRHYLKTNKIKNLGKTVFISPPARGSQLADIPVADILKSTLGEAVSQFKTSPDSFVNTLGEPDYDCYIIIGKKSNNFLYSILIPGDDDGMVPFKTSRLNNCKYKVFENDTHTSILKNETAINEIIKYLEN